MLAIITRSSAYKSSHGYSVWNSQGNTSKTMMDSRGLSTEPWWTPTWTLNTPLYELFILTGLLAFWYIIWTTCTIHSDMLTFLKAYHKTFLGPHWRPFLGQQMQIKQRFFPMYFSWICLKMKMASVVPRPRIKSDSTSSTFTTSPSCYLEYVPLVATWNC